MNASQHCNTCVKPLYDIITYCNGKEKEFNVIINAKCMPIQGFILAFVDECANPIIFDNYIKATIKFVIITKDGFDRCFIEKSNLKVIYDVNNNWSRIINYSIFYHQLVSIFLVQKIQLIKYFLQ